MISSREAGCVLAHTELPGDGIRFDVTITHIERPDCIYIQRVPPTEVDKGYSDDPDPTLENAAEELRTLEEIMAKINSADYFKNYTPLTTASEGERRLLFWSESGCREAASPRFSREWLLGNLTYSCDAILVCKI